MKDKALPVKGSEKMDKKIRVLVADDFRLLREDMIELLNKQPDMEVVGEAATGKEIVELAKNI